ncbi:MAG: hypothetical protein HGA77_11370 [Chlorobiaceae bacterium]|nr:hypothetical protein [Chlorobiaceae bacterium]
MIKINAVRIIPGYIEGMREPSLAAQFLLPNGTDESVAIQGLLKLLGPSLSSDQLDALKANNGKKPSDAINAIATAVSGLLASAGIPVLDSPVISDSGKTSKSNRENSVFEVFFPSYEPRTTLLTLEWVLKVLNNPDYRQKHLTPSLRNEFDQLLLRLQAVAPKGTNNIRFIYAAHALGIPVLPLPGSVFLYGWGAKGRWFRSSLSDETRAISVGHAKNKSATNALLQMGGLPVPHGLLVNSAAEAVTLAKKIGYPVVVKPADLDQGAGVYADLRTPQEVHDAFEQARKLSAHIMLEKYLKGTAYRITLVRGEPVAIVKRLPAGVTGDGISTIHSLVEKTNTDPRRSTRQFSIMKPIVIDNEARLILERQGLNMDSVPKDGVFIALKRAANVSTGGDTVLLNTDDIDSSYIELAKCAAELLRLDIAAVDFIAAGNIGTPLQENGTAIIEVNAQPQMGTILTHLHGQILKTYVQGDGTIPSMLVFGTDPDEFICDVRKRFSGNTHGLGSASSEGVFIGEKKISQKRHGMLAAARSLLINPEVTSLLLAIDPDSLTGEGMPLPFCHHLVIDSWPEKRTVSEQILSLFEKHLLGKVWIEQNNPLQTQIEQLLGSEKMLVFESRASKLDAIEKALCENGYE